MGDYNFFEIYEKKKGVSINPKSAIFICGLIMCLVILATAGLLVRNLYLSNKIETYNSKSEQIKASKDYIEASKLQDSIEAIKTYDHNAEIALKKFQQSNLIGTEVLSTITAAIPAQASLDTIRINNAHMDSTFNVADRKTASELVLNLKATALFRNVHLSSIAVNEGAANLQANVQCIMREKPVSKEGEKQ